MGPTMKKLIFHTFTTYILLTILPQRSRASELTPTQSKYIGTFILEKEHLESVFQQPAHNFHPHSTSQQNASQVSTLPTPNNLTISVTNTNCTWNATACEEDLQHAPRFENTTLIKGLVLSIIAVFSFVGNVATLASIYRVGRQGSSTVYMLLSQLAIADLLVTLFCILAEGVWTLTVAWYGGNVLCKVVKFVQMFALYLSTFVLVLIGFDRLCAVRFPMRRAHAKAHVRKGIACTWILSALFSLPQMVIFSVMKGPFVEEFYQCVTYAFYTEAWQEQLYTTLTLVLLFLLPLFILITTYICTFLSISNRSSLFSERVTSRSAIADARHKLLQKAKMRSLMITVVIVLTFVICWTPYYAMMIILMFLDPEDQLCQDQLCQDLQSAIFFFGSSTAMLNPLIYGAFHLRPRPRRPPRSASSFFGNSSSSRVENSLLTTIRRHPGGRRSIEDLHGHHVNGHSSTVVQYREKQRSVVSDHGGSGRGLTRQAMTSF